MATSRWRRPSRCCADYQQQLERVFTEVREATNAARGVDDRPGLPREELRRDHDGDHPRDAQADRRRARQRARRASPCTRRCCRSCSAARPRSPTARSTGAPARSSRSARCSWTAARSGWPARTRGAARSCQRFATIIDRTQRRRVDPAGQPRRGPGEVLRLRLAALGVRRAGLRVRLLGGPSGGAGALGGAVRRLRQRRPDDHRRVHHLRRDQVGPAVRRRAAAAARLRGPGPRPLLGPHRAVPHDGRRRRVRRSPSRRRRRATSTCCASTRSARSTGR